MTVALLSLELYLPMSQSLKDKRMVLRRLKDRLGAFNVAVAEVAHQEVWQRAGLVGRDRRLVGYGRRADVVVGDARDRAAGARSGDAEPGGVPPLRWRRDRGRIASASRFARRSAQLLLSEVHDPGIGFVTLTRVKVSPDLQLVRVYYTQLGDEKARHETRRALERATPFLRRQLGSRVRLRRVPELRFEFDTSVENQDRIERILLDLQAEREERDKAGVGDRTSTGDTSDKDRDSMTPGCSVMLRAGTTKLPGCCTPSAPPP